MVSSRFGPCVFASSRSVSSSFSCFLCLHFGSIFSRVGLGVSLSFGGVKPYIFAWFRVAVSFLGTIHFVPVPFRYAPVPFRPISCRLFCPPTLFCLPFSFLLLLLNIYILKVYRCRNFGSAQQSFAILLRNTCRFYTCKHMRETIYAATLWSNRFLPQTCLCSLSAILLTLHHFRTCSKRAACQKSKVPSWLRARAARFVRMQRYRFGERLRAQRRVMQAMGMKPHISQVSR